MRPLHQTSQLARLVLFREEDRRKGLEKLKRQEWTLPGLLHIGAYFFRSLLHFALVRSIADLAFKYKKAGAVSAFSINSRLDLSYC